MKSTTSKLLIVALLGCAACTTPPEKAPPKDAGVEQTADANNLDGQVLLTLPPGDDGAAVVGALAPGEIRAGRITEAKSLLSGIKVEGKLGDFKIYNDRVAFVIAAARETDGYSPYGGEILDAQRLGVTVGEGRSLLGETVFGAGTRTIKAKSVGVVADGKDGQAAIIRVIGEPAIFPLLSSLLPQSAIMPLYLVVDYVLEPNSDALEIRWRFINKTRQATRLPLPLLGILAGDGLEFFADGNGFNIKSGNVAETEWVGMVAPTISYGLLARPGSTLSPLATYNGVWAVALGALEIPAAGEAIKTIELVVAPGRPEGLREALRRRRGVPEPAGVGGVVRDPQGQPVAGARIHAQRAAGGYATMAESDATGTYQLGLPAGEYTLTAVAEGRAVETIEKVAVKDGTATTQDITLAETATLAFEVKDDKGTAIPAKLIIAPRAPLPSLPASFGERTYPGGAAKVLFHTGVGANAKGQVQLPPGEYTVTASRGFEYEIDVQTLTLEAAAPSTTTFTLKHSVDTTGYMCGDFHIHSLWSPDSSDLQELKVASFVAEGLELAVATDHEYITDYNPLIAKMGLGAWTHGIIGEELTTFAYGHFNPFPVLLDPSKANNGAMPWWTKDPPTLFADVRKAWPQAVFQVNHPRSAPISGYLNYVGYDPETGVVKHPKEWSLDFDALEVFNSSGWKQNASGTVRDWFSLLDRGKRTTATGNSDSHTALSTEVGYPRNYVALSTDDPSKLEIPAFAQAVKNQRVLVSGGPFVTVSINGKSMGELVDASAKQVQLTIKVQAPTWIATDTLRVILGGKDGGDEVATITLDASKVDPQNPVVRFDESVPLTLTKDTWVVVVVQGKGSLSPVVRGKEPFAMTNPIYLDVDGDGAYDPPFRFPE